MGALGNKKNLSYLDILSKYILTCSLALGISTSNLPVIRMAEEPCRLRANGGEQTAPTVHSGHGTTAGAARSFSRELGVLPPPSGTGLPCRQSQDPGVQLRIYIEIIWRD